MEMNYKYKHININVLKSFAIKRGHYVNVWMKLLLLFQIKMKNY
jgi:hypothetical protein